MRNQYAENWLRRVDYSGRTEAPGVFCCRVSDRDHVIRASLASRRRRTEDGADRPRGVGDVLQQLGERIAQRQRRAIPLFGDQHVIDHLRAMQDPLLLPLERLDGEGSGVAGDRPFGGLSVRAIFCA